MVTPWSKSVFLILIALSVVTGCASGEGICEKVCEKSVKCDEEDEGYRRVSDCNTQCEETAELTEEVCQQEFRRLSKCYRRRFDCDGSHNDACRRRRDQLNTCLSAQQN